MDAPVLVVILAVGLVFYIVVQDWMEARRTKNYLLTEATVVEVVPIVIPSLGRSGLGPTYRWKVKYHYTDQRGVLHYGSNDFPFGDPTGGVQGSTIAIKYDPKDPRRSVIP